MTRATLPLPGAVGLTLFPSTCSSIADATSQALLLFDPDDVQLNEYLLEESRHIFYPLATLHSQYWNKPTQFPDRFIPSPLSNLGEIFIFSQYEYIEARIENFRKLHKDDRIQPGVALIGTPGIGEWSPSTSSHRPNNLSGKTTFLIYFLIRELMRARPTIYFTNREFYIFNQAGVHNVKEEPVFGPGWNNTACLVNADYKNAPGYLMVDSRSLFVITASSPRPGHRHWVKQREGSKQFVLNPPSGDELVKVLVQSFIPSPFLCLHSPVSL